MIGMNCPWPQIRYSVWILRGKQFFMFLADDLSILTISGGHNNNTGSVCWCIQVFLNMSVLPQLVLVLSLHVD